MSTAYLSSSDAMMLLLSMGAQIPNNQGSVEGMLRSVIVVDGSRGGDGNHGDLDHPLLTVNEAIARCHSENGNHICLFPGSYNENVLVSELNYLKMFTAYEGRYGRPDIVPDAGIGMSITQSQGVVLRGLRIYSADSDVFRNDSNGFKYTDCVFDGDTGMAATEGLMRLWCHSSDDSFTASEGQIENCDFRGSNGFGVVFDCQNAAVGVLPTDNVFRNCRFHDNVAEDIFLAATAVSVADIKRTIFERLTIGSGKKNKATHIDLQTNKIGVAGSFMFNDCFINDDTIDTTAVKIASTGGSGCGGYSLDGVINWDALD